MWWRRYIWQLLLCIFRFKDSKNFFEYCIIWLLDLIIIVSSCYHCLNVKRWGGFTIYKLWNSILSSISDTRKSGCELWFKLSTGLFLEGWIFSWLKSIIIWLERLPDVSFYGVTIKYFVFYFKLLSIHLLESRLIVPHIIDPHSSNQLFISLHLVNLVWVSYSICYFLLPLLRLYSFMIKLVLGRSFLQ